MIALDLNKRKALDVDPKAIQQTNFPGSLENNAVTFFITEEAKEKVLDFSREAVKVFYFFFFFNKMTQYNTLNVKLSNSQLNKIKS